MSEEEIEGMGGGGGSMSYPAGPFPNLMGN